jgi:hypothetical protein
MSRRRALESTSTSDESGSDDDVTIIDGPPPKTKAKAHLNHQATRKQLDNMKKLYGRFLQ